MGSLPVNSSVLGVYTERSERAQDLRQINALVIDPRDPKFVFAAGPAGVFRSSDEGLTWEASSQNLSPIAALAIYPNQPDTIFAATAEGALFRSDDAGRSWKSISSSP